MNYFLIILLACVAIFIIMKTGRLLIKLLATAAVVLLVLYLLNSFLHLF